MKTYLFCLLSLISSVVSFSQVKPINDDCSNAIKPKMDTLYRQQNILPDLDNVFPCYQSQNQSFRGVWYEVEGNDSILIVYPATENIRVAFKVGNCDSLKCLQYVYLTRPYVQYIEKGKTYKIFVYTDGYSISKSDYSVKFSMVAVDSSSFCENAPFLDCGGDLSIPSKSLIYDHESVSGNFDGNFKFAWFKIKGNGGLQTLKYLNSQSNNSITSIYEGPCNDSIQQHLLYANSSYELPFRSELNKEYYVRVGINSHILEPLVVNLSCTPLDTVLMCSGAKSINCGDQFFNQKLERLDVHVLEPDNNKLYGLWYKLPLETEKQLQIGFNSSNFGQLNARLFKSNGVDCDDLEYLLSTNINLSGDNLKVDLIDNDQFYLLLNGYSSEPFDMTTNCIALGYQNNSCQNSTLINVCNDSINVVNSFTLDKTSDSTQFALNASGKWFKFVGGDKPIMISSKDMSFVQVEVFQDDCGQLGLPILQGIPFNSNPFVMDVVSGREYFLRFKYDENARSIPSFKVIFSCFEGALNGLRCDDAIDISCGETRSTQTQNSLYDPLTTSDCGSINGNLWFKFIGDGSVKNIIGSDGVYIINVYSSSDCRNLTCEAFSNGRNFVTLPTEIGVTYYCIPFHGGPTGTIEMKCVDPEVNNTCDKALPISCNDTEIPLNFGQTYQIDNYTYKASALWYEIEGDDNLIQLRTKFGSTIGIMQACSQDTIKTFLSGGYSLFGKKGQTYKIKIINQSNRLDTLTINCLDNVVYNSTCDGVIALGCDTTLRINYVNRPSSIFLGYSDGALSVKESWYRFDGNGKNKIFTALNQTDFAYEIYENDCNSKDISRSYNYNQSGKFVVNTEIGKTYYVNILHFGTAAFIDFDISCGLSIPNFKCQYATPIGCDQTIVIKPSDVSQNTVLVDGSGILRNVSWFKIESSENSMLVLQDAGAAGIVYESNSDCDSIKIIANLFGSQPIIINRKPGYNYFVAIGNFNYFNLEVDIKMTHTCIPITNINDFPCENRKMLACGKSYTIDGSSLIQSTFNNCTYTKPGPWYEVVGDGSYFQFALTGNQSAFSSISMIIGEGTTCADAECTCVIPSTNDGYYGFQSQVGVRYFIKLSFEQYINISNLTLQFTCIADMQNDKCTEAITVSCGQSITGIVSSTATNVDTLNVCQTVNKGNYYIFEGNGDNITFLFSGISAGILSYEIIESSCTQGRCLFIGAVSSHGWVSKNQFTIDTKKNISYIIKLHSDVDCAYTFTTSCFETHENTTCQLADFMQCNKSYHLNLQSPLGVNTSSGCFGTAGQIEHWFQLPKNQKWFKFNFDSLNDDMGLSISYLKGPCNGLKCVQEWNGSSQNIAVYGNDDDDYYVRITRVYYAPNVDSIDFTLSCIDGIANDLCQNAIELRCGDQDTISTFLSSYTPLMPDCLFPGIPDIWYTLKGNDSIYLLTIDNVLRSGTITVFRSSDCSTLSCKYPPTYLYYPQNFISIPTTKDSTYFIQIQSESASQEYRFEWNVSCLPKLENDLCQGAFNVNLIADTIALPFILASPDLENVDNCNQNFVYPIKNGLWYTFNGNDLVTTFSSSINGYNLRYLLFEGTCGQWKCIENDIIQYEGRDIYTEVGKSYLMVIYISDQYPHDLQMYVKNKSLATNWICESPQDLICGSTIVMDKTKLYFDSNSECTNSGGHLSWYTIKSDTGAVIRINSIDIPSKTTFMVYDSCGVKCETFFDLAYTGSYTQIAIPKGKELLIECIGDQRYYSNPFTYNIECVTDGYKHINPANAIELECGKNVINPSKAGKQFDFPFSQLEVQGLYYSFVANDTVLRYQSNGSIPFNVYYYNTATNQFGNLTFVSQFPTTKGVKYYLIMDYSPSRFEDVNYEFELLGLCGPINTNESTAFNELKISPNPFIDHFTITFQKPIEESSQLTIYDQLGKIMVQVDLSLMKGQTDLIVNQLNASPSGVYYIEYRSGSSYGKTKVINIK